MSGTFGHLYVLLLLTWNQFWQMSQLSPLLPFFTSFFQSGQSLGSLTSTFSSCNYFSFSFSSCDSFRHVLDLYSQWILCYFVYHWFHPNFRFLFVIGNSCLSSNAVVLQINIALYISECNEYIYNRSCSCIHWDRDSTIGLTRSNVQMRMKKK